MRILSKSTLKEFWQKHADVKIPLAQWYAAVQKEFWLTPHDIKQHFSSADFVGDKVVFYIGGNKYRLIVVVNYHASGWVFIKFVGTHDEYNKIDVKSL